MTEGETYVRLFYQGMSLLVPMSFVLNAHPGGAEYILQYANQDITAAFADMNHSTDAQSLLQGFEETGEEVRRGGVIYDPEHRNRSAAVAAGVSEEQRRLSEVRWWRRRQVFVTSATTLAAMGAVVFALRRGSLQVR